MFIVKNVSKYPQKPLQTPASNAGPWLADLRPGTRLVRVLGQERWGCRQTQAGAPHGSARHPAPPHTIRRGQVQAVKPSQSISYPRPPSSPSWLATAPHLPPHPPSASPLLSPPSTPGASPSLFPQTPPKSGGQFSASLPGAGKPETAQVRHGHLQSPSPASPASPCSQ